MQVRFEGMKKVPAQIAKRHGLSPKMRAFVDELLRNGGKVTDAVIAVGYTGKNPRAMGSKWWRATGVQEAYRASILDDLSMGAAGAIKSMIDLAISAESEHAKIMAAKDILDRVGIGQQQQQAPGGITINFGLKGISDTDATQAVTIDSNAVEITELSTGEQGDDPSY